MKMPILFICGFFFALQLTGCRQDEAKNAAPPEKDQPLKPGPGEGGGGDPHAQKFIFLSQKLARYYQDNPANLDIPFSVEEFSALVTKLDASLKDSQATDLVEFTDASLVDQNGVSKLALFDKTSGTIKVNRSHWNSASDEDKFILINMEIAGLLGVELRYEHSLALVKDRAALILAMHVPEAGEKTPIGWWIANQDPNIFSRISENDVIIDGGIIGTGSETNQRIVHFFKSPNQDQEWFALFKQSRTQGTPIYMLLRDPYGSRATLTAFTPTQSGAFTIYTLLFSATSKPVGICDHASTEISSLERIKNCFFDTRFYFLTDTQSDSLAQLNYSLESHFARSPETMAVALQTALVQDYRRLFTPQFHNFVLNASTRAYGLKPTLSAGETAFWDKNSQIDLKSLRLHRAFEVMARDQVGFYPGQESQCDYIFEGNHLSSTNEPPRIVPIKELRVMIQEDRCLLRDWYGFEGKFYHALAQHGYVYNDITQAWRKEAPRKVSLSLMQTEVERINEIETQIVSQNLSSDLSYKLIKHNLTSGDLAQRLSFYSILLHWKPLGLSVDQATELFRLAIKDISQLDNPEDPNSLPWEFIQNSLDLAVVNKLISPQLSQEYIAIMFESPLFDENMASNVFFVMKYENSLTQSESFALLKKLIKTGFPIADDKSDVDHWLRMFQIGAELEQKTKAQNLNRDEQVLYLRNKIKSANQSAPLGAAIKKFLTKNPTSPKALSPLLEELMWLIVRSNDKEDGLRFLAEMTFEVSMTKAQRETLYRFLLLNFKNGEDKRARAHLIFEMQYVSRQSMDVRQQYQLLLELFAQSSTQKVGETGLLPELEAEDRTAARRIVRDISDCRIEGGSSAMCEYITSPNVILSLIAQNKNLSDVTRQAAHLELRVRH